MDIYDYVNSSLQRNNSVAWDIANYPVLGSGLVDCDTVYLCGYKSSAGIYGGYKGAYRYNYVTYPNYMVSCNDTTKVTLGSLVKSDSFTPATNKVDNWGYIISSKPFECMINQTSIDFDKIPDNYVITINGDTIYDYSVTNPDTGQTSTVNNYVNNNYNLPEKEPSGGDDSGGSSGGSGTVSGNVTVGGKVDVSGKIDISTNPIDINVNVNNSGSGSSGGSGSGDSSGVEFDQDLSLNNYYNWMQQQSTGFSGFMKQFLSWLPEDIVIMLCAGLALVILARFIGR